MCLCPVEKSNSSVQLCHYTYIFWCLQYTFTSAASQIEHFWLKTMKKLIYSSLYAALTACYCIPCQTHCVLFNNLLKIPVLAVLARNASGTPRDRWHYEANAGLPACVAVLLWGKRSGLVAESGPPSFPGVSNGRHQNPISAVLRSGWGHICPGRDTCGRNHTAARTKITRVASNRALYMYAECGIFAPTARASRKFKNKKNPLIQYRLCILTFRVYMCDVSAMILLDV